MDVTNRCRPQRVSTCRQLARRRGDVERARRWAARCPVRGSACCSPRVRRVRREALRQRSCQGRIHRAGPACHRLSCGVPLGAKTLARAGRRPSFSALYRRALGESARLGRVRAPGQASDGCAGQRRRRAGPRGAPVRRSWPRHDSGRRRRARRYADCLQLQRRRRRRSTDHGSPRPCARSRTGFDTGREPALVDASRALLAFTCNPRPWSGADRRRSRPGAGGRPTNSAGHGLQLWRGCLHGHDRRLPTRVSHR